MTDGVRDGCSGIAHNGEQPAVIVSMWASDSAPLLGGGARCPPFEAIGGQVQLGKHRRFPRIHDHDAEVLKVPDVARHQRKIMS